MTGPPRPPTTGRYAATFAGFVLGFAALRPVFLGREPDAFPVLGNSIFYSFPEVMEAAYFTASFVAFVGLVLVLSVAGWLRMGPVTHAAIPHAPAGGRDRLLVAIALVAPCVILLLPPGPPVLVADMLHHGEKLIFQDRPLAEAWRSYYPFKPLLFMKLGALAGLDSSVAGYLAVRDVTQRLGYLAAFVLVLLVVRVIRGRLSLLPAVLFLLAYPLFDAGLRYRYWILDMERLLLMLLALDAVLVSLVLRRQWPLLLAGAFTALQFLASIEYAIFAALALAAHVAWLALRDRREGARAAVAVVAGALPVALALQATGQLVPLLGFIRYTTRFPSLYGTPLLYSRPYPAPAPAPAVFLVPLVAAWLILLWAAGRWAPRVLIGRQLDERSLWTVMTLLLAILSFKVGLGRSDVQHLYVPLLFTALFLLTVALGRASPLPPVPRAASVALLVASAALAVVAAARRPGVPAGFVFDPSPRVRASIPGPLEEDLAALRALLSATGSRSFFFFSDQPLYNVLLDAPYGLRNPSLHEILTDDMLARETEAFLAWSPDLVVWRAHVWTGYVDRIRTPVRDYRLAAAILARYRPLASRGGWLILARDPDRADRAALRSAGFAPLSAAGLEETFDWRDMAYHIGRSPAAPADFKRVTLTRPADGCCAYRQDGRALVTFRARAGMHTYAFFPAMAPGYREESWSPDSVVCGPCREP